MEILEPETVSGNGGVNAGLHTALGHLHQFIPLDNDIGAACQMLEEAAVNCGEALDSLRSARERVDLDPSRLENAAESLSRLHELSRKHRVPMDGLEAVMVALAGRIERAGSSEKRRIELENELQGRLADYRKAAKKLHQQRKKHAAELSSRVTALMADLGMAGGTFELAVELDLQAPPSARGDDSLAISISANPGLPPGPLNKIASGGELSRISLAIKVATAGGGDAVTQIFDEVDAGIGGDTANAVGRLIQRLSQRAGAGIGQALCVTHLAQVAVCAKHQLQVRKETGKETTVVDTNMLGIDERVDEIARMLSGTISDQSRAHAGELLAQANKSD
jgi:DNA repair protein RecN (Recombination protein N)